jgi:hypothetical protein
MSDDEIEMDDYGGPLVIREGSTGKQYTFVGTDPREERVVCLDDLPRDEFGSIVMPNEPWDGVSHSPGILFAPPEGYVERPLKRRH